MRKLYVILLAIVTTNIALAQNTVVTFQADIANRNGDVIYIKDNSNKTITEIKLDEKGSGKESFSVTDDFYVLFDGVEYAQLFLKNGYDLKVKLDAKQFDETIKFSGKGEVENNYLAATSLLEQKYDYQGLLAMAEADFNKNVDEKVSKEFSKLDQSKLDAKFIEIQKKSLGMSIDGLKKYYNQKLAANKMNNLPSAGFDYENQKGGKTSLESLRGKYVYIDIWATWCGPCRAEIPSLKLVEAKYHDKNIAFVSVSVDVDKDHDKWKTFVADKELGGIQLFADKNWNSDFIRFYGINSIPRFILIDPKGNIVKADAERPSDPNLQTLLDSLLQ